MRDDFTHEHGQESSQFAAAAFTFTFTRFRLIFPVYSCFTIICFPMDSAFA